MNKSKEMFEGFNVYLDAKGYKLIWIDGRNVKIHVLVWERVNGPKPKGFEIHHIDHDKGNYSIDNLQLMTKSDHRRLHAGWVKGDCGWLKKPCTGCGDVLPLSDFYPRKGYTPSAKCKTCHCKQTKQWGIDNPEARKRISNDWYNRNKTGGKNNVGE